MQIAISPTVKTTDVINKVFLFISIYNPDKHVVPCKNIQQNIGCCAMWFFRQHRRWRLTVPAVVLEHVEGGVGEERGTRHRLVARLSLWTTQFLYNTLTVSQ